SSRRIAERQRTASDPARAKSRRRVRAAAKPLVRSPPRALATLMLLEINSQFPEPRKVQRAVDALLAGEVIAYPTDTVYGLGCDITNKKAVDRLYAIKGMDRSRALAMICPDLSEI